MSEESIGDLPLPLFELRIPNRTIWNQTRIYWCAKCDTIIVRNCSVNTMQCCGFEVYLFNSVTYGLRPFSLFVPLPSIHRWPGECTAHFTVLIIVNEWTADGLCEYKAIHFAKRHGNEAIWRNLWYVCCIDARLEAIRSKYLMWTFIEFGKQCRTKINFG